MRRKRSSRTSDFARQLLREHPQISYDNAVQAARYAGLKGISRPIFYKAAKALGIERRGGPRSSRVAVRPNSPDAALVERLSAEVAEARQILEETERMHDALLEIRLTIQVALDEPSF